MKIEFYSTLRLDLKIKKIDYTIEKPTTVEELLHRLSKDIHESIYPKLVKDGKPIKGTNILINGKNFFHIKELETIVTNEDLVQIFPPAAGG
jgi:molybdopterin synthase sulfur carrier subunit